MISEGVVVLFINGGEMNDTQHLREDQWERIGRSLPLEYGKWSSTHKRVKRWADKSVLQRIFNALALDF